MTVLHLWIHALDFILRVASHLRCGHLQYNETRDIKEDCDTALKEIQKVRFLILIRFENHRYNLVDNAATQRCQGGLVLVQG